jgi:cytoskeletal protein CcmA (bactofilin family)
MFFKSSAQTQVSSANSAIDSLIGTGAEIHGDVTFSGGMRIDGVIRGNVRLEEGKTGVLMLGETGRILGNVYVSHLIIDGSIEGSVYVSELAEIGSTAHVCGDLHYAVLEAQPGAEIEGKLRKMQPQIKLVSQSGQLDLAGVALAA